MQLNTHVADMTISPFGCYVASNIPVSTSLVLQQVAPKAIRSFTADTGRRNCTHWCNGTKMAVTAKMLG